MNPLKGAEVLSPPLSLVCDNCACQSYYRTYKAYYFLNHLVHLLPSSYVYIISHFHGNVNTFFEKSQKNFKKNKGAENRSQLDYFPNTPTLSKITRILIMRVLRFKPLSVPARTPLFTSFFIVGFAQFGILSSI